MPATKRAPDARTAPERVRRYLDKHGRTEVSAAAIWHTFGLSSPARGARERVARRLVDAGVEVEPPLRDLDAAETRVTLRLAEPRVAVDREWLERLLLGLGAVATALSLFLPWYTGSRAGIEIPDLSTGWEWLGVLDVYLLAVAIGAGLLLFAIARAGPDSTRGLASAVAAAAGVGVLAVLYRLLTPPDDVFERFVLELGLDVGPFVYLLGTGAVAVGAIASAAPSLRFSALGRAGSGARRRTAG